MKDSVRLYNRWGTNRNEKHPTKIENNISRHQTETNCISKHRFHNDGWWAKNIKGLLGERNTGSSVLVLCFKINSHCTLILYYYCTFHFISLKLYLLDLYESITVIVTFNKLIVINIYIYIHIYFIAVSQVALRLYRWHVFPRKKRIMQKNSFFPQQINEWPIMFQ